MNPLSDPLAVLQNIDGIRIHQRVERLEANTSITETENKYSIHALHRITHGRARATAQGIAQQPIQPGIATNHPPVGGARMGTAPMAGQMTTTTTTTTGMMPGGATGQVALPEKIHIRVGELLFKATETSAATNVTGSKNTSIAMMDAYSGRAGLTIVKPFKIIGKFVTVYDGNGSYLGKIKKGANPLTPRVTVYDAYDNVLDKITGSLRVPWRRKLSIWKGNYEVGRIEKRYSGAVKSALTDSDTFDLIFPHEISVEEKGLLIAATMFIDMLFFNNLPSSLRRITSRFTQPTIRTSTGAPTRPMAQSQTAIPAQPGLTSSGYGYGYGRSGLAQSAPTMQPGMVAQPGLTSSGYAY